MYNKKYNSTNPNLITKSDLYCRFCGKQCKNLDSLRNHERLCKLNPNRQLSPYEKYGLSPNFTGKGKAAWNKGLTKETDERVRRNSEAKKEHFQKCPGTFTGRKHTEISKQRMSEAHLAIDHANCNHNSHGKRGYKDGMFFMSSYELAFYLYTKITSPDVLIERCHRRYEYVIENKKHYYTPDFILNNVQIVEIKGRETDLDRYKYTLVENITVLRRGDIEPMIRFLKHFYQVEDICCLYDIKYN